MVLTAWFPNGAALQIRHEYSLVRTDVILDLDLGLKTTNKHYLNLCVYLHTITVNGWLKLSTED